MKFTDNAINVMAARTYKGIGKAWITKFLPIPIPESEIVLLLNKSGKFSSKISIEEFIAKKKLIHKVLKIKID